MQASTVSERLSFGVRSIELMKWVGLAAMLVEHVAHFALGVTNGWPFVVGRLAFPLFTIALAVGCAQKTIPELREVAARLFAWGMVAAISGMLVRQPVPLNVLFTFALGVVLHVVTRGFHVGRWLVGAVVLFAAMFVEYKALGVIAVAVALHGAREDRPASQCGWIALSLLLIASVKFNASAILALPAVFLINLGRIELPRVRGGFYWAYAGHWVVLGALGLAL